ncbi:unnamed protein product [Gordionus sp. m RMFG-2023]
MEECLKIAPCIEKLLTRLLIYHLPNLFLALVKIFLINEGIGAEVDDIDTMPNLTTRPLPISKDRQNNSSTIESRILRDKFKKFLNS